MCNVGRAISDHSERKILVRPSVSIRTRTVTMQEVRQRMSRKVEMYQRTGLIGGLVDSKIRRSRAITIRECHSAYPPKFISRQYAYLFQLSKCLRYIQS